MLRAHRGDKHTYITLLCPDPPGCGYVTAFVSLKLTRFPNNRPAVVHNLQGKFSYINYNYASGNVIFDEKEVVK
jgi:hypothetical protein